MRFAKELRPPPKTANPKDFLESQDSLETIHDEALEGIRKPKKRKPVDDVLSPPYSAAVSLTFYNTDEKPIGKGCGYFVTGDILLTAGHNTEAPETTSIAAFPAFDAVQNPDAEKLAVMDWVQHDTRDAGLMIVNGWHDAVLKLRDSADEEVGILAGYAHSAIGKLPQLTAASHPVSVEDSQMSYAIKTLRGDSGAPVIAESDGKAIGVHFYGKNRPDGFVGLAEKMDDDLQVFVDGGIKALRKRQDDNDNGRSMT